MSKYEICTNETNNFFNQPSIADHFAAMCLSHPDIHTVKVVKRITTEPQLGIGIRVFDTPIFIGGSYGRKEVISEEYTYYKY